MSRWLTALDQARAAVPMVLVAGLAGFTWWLVQSAPKDSGPAQTATASSSPDYELGQARVERYNLQGRLVAVIDGKAMRHFAVGDRLEIQSVQIAARDDTGRHLHAVANEGQANGVAETVVLRGGARVVATPASGVPNASPVVFEGELMTIDTRHRQVKSDLPVKITQAHAQVQAGQLVFDERQGVTQLGQGVKGRYDAVGR
ncbi:MAG: LPS export ABC transporter periplasmic protein LptC [Pseudomonadota bacterium]